MSRTGNSASLSRSRVPLGIIGPVVDDRGTAACDYIRARCDRVIEMVYNPSRMALCVDNSELDISELDTIFRGVSFVLLETTTLGFVEIALCLRTLRESQCPSIHLVYLEPEDYTKFSTEVLHCRDFALTDEVSLYSGVPGWVKRLDSRRNQRVVFLLGFEGQRLAQSFEQLELTPKGCSVVFGVPAYSPGWELNAFANNISTIHGKISGGVAFSGADNPYAIVEYLEELHQIYSRHNDLFVVPIGTKPHGIGAALFAAMHPDIGLFYDNPQKQTKRTKKFRTWHYFEVGFHES